MLLTVFYMLLTKLFSHFAFTNTIYLFKIFENSSRLYVKGYLVFTSNVVVSGRKL